LAGTSLLFHIFDVNIVSFSEKNRAKINLLCWSLGCHAIFLGTGVVCNDLDMYLKRVALCDLQCDQHVTGADPGIFQRGNGWYLEVVNPWNMLTKCCILRIGT